MTTNPSNSSAPATVQAMLEADQKRADQLVGASLARPEDDYGVNIKNAARALTDAGYGGAEYLTQYSSGNTAWRLSATYTVGVDRLGNIK